VSPRWGFNRNFSSNVHIPRRYSGAGAPAEDQRPDGCSSSGDDSEGPLEGGRRRRHHDDISRHWRDATWQVDHVTLHGALDGMKLSKLQVGTVSARAQWGVWSFCLV